jgi:hypothetical protein
LLKKLPPIPDIPESDQTDWVKSLPALLEQFAQRVQYHSEEIALLKDEINILKGEKKRPGSAKRKKTQALVINEDKIIKPDGFIPAGSRFKG